MKYAIAIGAIVVSVLNLTGFCFLEGRYLSNRRVFEIAIAHQASKIGDYSQDDTPRSYLAKHVNCCSIPVFQPENSFLNIILGYRIRYVRVVYRRHQAEIDQHPKSGDFYEAYVEISPCGRTFHAIGTTLTEMAELQP